MSKAVDIPYKTRKKESSLPLEKKVKVDGNMSEAFNWLPSDIFDTLSQDLLEQRYYCLALCFTCTYYFRGVSGFLKLGGGQVVMRRGASGFAFYSAKKGGGQIAPPCPPSLTPLYLIGFFGNWSQDCSGLQIKPFCPDLVLISMQMCKDLL